MPVVSITTNATVPIAAKVELAAAVTQGFCEILRTPKEHVHVLIQDAQFLSFGGDYTTPAAYITVHSSTRSIMEDARKALVDRLTPILQSTLGLDTTRTTTFFQDHPVENIAVGSQIIQFSSPRSPPSVQHAGMFRVAV